MSLNPVWMKEVEFPLCRERDGGRILHPVSQPMDNVCQYLLNSCPRSRPAHCHPLYRSALVTPCKARVCTIVKGQWRHGIKFLLTHPPAQSLTGMSCVWIFPKILSVLFNTIIINKLNFEQK